MTRRHFGRPHRASELMRFAPLLLVVLCSCGPAYRRAFVPNAAPRVEAVSVPVERLAEPEMEREDSPDEAADFYLLKRTGGTPLPTDLLLAARDHARRMPVYSVARRRFVPRAVALEGGSAGKLGTWQPLGP